MNQHPVYRFDDFVVDPEAWLLSRGGQEIHLDPVVLKLLIFLIINHGRLVTRRELMDTVWGKTVISESALTKAVARLRKALGDDSTTHRYLETVRSQGYRFVAEVNESVQEAPVALPIRETWTLTTRHGALIGIAISLLALLGFLIWQGTVGRIAPYSGEIQSIAVLPLKNLTGDFEQDHMAHGLQDSLTTELSRIDELRVTSFQSTMRYRGSDRVLPEIASELGVDALVEGSVLRIGERIEVNLQLIDGRTDEHIWAKHFEREAPYIFDLLTTAAEEIGITLGFSTDHEMVGPVDPRAIRAYWLGLDYLTRFSPESLVSAIAHFRTATEIEPHFDLAWGNLAAAHAMQAAFGFAPSGESIEKARFAAEQAIRVGNRPSFGYAALGWVRFWSQDLQGGCNAFREALRINPSAPFAIHGDADCLLHEGHVEESLDRLRELALIAPFSFMHQLPLSFHLFLARRYDESLEVALSVQERFPNSTVHVNLSQIYWQQRLYDKALQQERRKLQLYGDIELLAVFDENEAEADPQELMLTLAGALVKRAAESYVDPFEIGETYARAGAVNEAIYWLARAVEQKSFEVVHMPFRPDFDILRVDPRFTELEEKVILPQPKPTSER